MRTMKSAQSIALIGMAGVGKTSFGKHLASQKNLPFLDTDDLLEKSIQMPLQAYIETFGPQALLEKESHILCELTPEKPSIISTGGSVIYSEKAMNHLRTIARIIWLKDSFENIQKRILNLNTRGLINPEDKPLISLFNDREVLYRKYADQIFIYPHFFNPKIIRSRLEELI